MEYLDKDAKSHLPLKPWAEAIRMNSQMNGKKYLELDEKSLKEIFQSFRVNDLLSITCFLMQQHLNRGFEGTNENLSLQSHSHLMARVDSNKSNPKSDEIDDDKKLDWERELQEKIAKLEREIDDMEMYLCNSCGSGKKTHILEPCKHYVCEKCANTIKTCPTCNTKIQTSLKTYH